MIDSLRLELEAAARRDQRLQLVRAVCWTFSAVLATSVLLALADSLSRLEDRNVRLMASISVVAVAAWVAIRLLVPALRYRPTIVEMARKIESRYPRLNDRLSSAVQFLYESQDESRSGSQALRRAVVAQSQADVEGVSCRTIVDVRPARRAMWIAGLTALAALVLIFLAPTSARVAAARLVNPLGDVRWPHANNLGFAKVVSNAVLGGSFEVEIVDRNGELPCDTRIQYRYPRENGTFAIEEDSELRADGAGLIARKDQVNEPFEYRAVGGDDRDMPWISVKIVESTGVVPPAEGGGR